MSEIRFEGKTRYEERERDWLLRSSSKPTERYDKCICFLAHRVSNLNVMSENRDKVYDPVPDPTPGN